MVFFVSEHLTDEMHVSYSSSVDHFIMDGDLYDRKYLNLVDDEYELNTEYGGHEFFVKTGESPTWRELNEYCNTK